MENLKRKTKNKKKTSLQETFASCVLFSQVMALQHYNKTIVPNREYLLPSSVLRLASSRAVMRSLLVGF